MHKFYHMKTKIVYVLVSKENDIYLEQAWLSLYSLRLHNPTTHVVVLVDATTESSLVGKREKFKCLPTEIIVVDTPQEYTPVQRSRYIKTSARKYISGDFLFIDTDTIVTDKLDELDTLEIEIGAVPEFHVDLNHFPGVNGLYKVANKLGWKYDENDKYNFNSGAVYAKDTKKAHQFYDTWFQCWQKSIATLGRHHDQPPMAMADHILGHPISPISGIWNCQILEHGIFYLPNAKVIHYFGTSIPKSKDDYIYAFEDKNILLEIKMNGDITPRIHNLLINAKQLCNANTQIVAGAETDLLYTQTYHVIKNLYKNHRILFETLNKILIFLGKIKCRL